MEAGYAGMANTGLVAFYGIGAFMTGFVSISSFLAYYGYKYPIYSLDAVIVLGQVSNKNPALSIGVFLLSMILSFLVSGAVGYLVCYPTLRVGPAFLGITILSFGEMMRVFLKHFSPTGGSYGLLGIPHPFAWISDSTLKSQLFLLLTLAALTLVFVYFKRLSNSPYGRVLKSIREDEVAALCIGKAVPKTKAKLLFVASGISAIAGSFLTFYLGSVSPDMFVTAVTFEVWSMVILGGRANNVGVILGAALFSLLGRASSALPFLLPSLAVDPNYIRWMLTGAVIVIVLLYRPKGVLAEKPVYTGAWRIYESVEEGGVFRRGGRTLKKALSWLLGRSVD
jgi:branched-chain amino acid transport system permease protein